MRMCKTLSVSLVTMCLLLNFCTTDTSEGLAKNSSSVPSIWPIERVQIQPFDYKGVRLEDGRLKWQFEEVKKYYLSVPNDDYLKGFRKRAGFSTPGKEMGGWYTGDTFHIFGQVISGLSRMYAASGDKACLEKVDYLVAEWGKCIGPDGFFFYSDKPNAPHYIYDKMVGGLVDAYLYCGDNDALKYLSQITDWAIKNLDRTKDHSKNIEWYTLSENLYRAWLVTGDKKYRDFAQVWQYRHFWDGFNQNEKLFLNPDGRAIDCYHAYSHMNSLSGLGAGCLVTGDDYYLQTLRNAHDYFQRQFVFATGGYGPSEMLLPSKQLTSDTLKYTHRHFETQCGSWAAFKVSKYLVALTGEAKYGQRNERLIYNGIGASVPMATDGSVMYFSDYCTQGGVKKNIAAWSCCTGTRPQAIADYTDLIYFKDTENLYVNLFVPSSVKWTRKTNTISVTQETRFPESSTVEFEIGAGREERFGIKVRIPEWMKLPITASINGKTASYEADQKHWASFHRKWKDGDILRLNFPMHLYAARFDEAKEFPVTIMYGPVVMAVRSLEGNPATKIDFSVLDEVFVPCPGEALTWRLKSVPSILLRPFYVYKEGEPYYLYLDPEPPDFRLSADNWGGTTNLFFSDDAGAVAQFGFTGVGVRWTAQKQNNGGFAEVKIDGEIIEIVDLYARETTEYIWEYSKLAPGKHTMVITSLGKKSKSSKWHTITLKKLEAIVNVENNKQ